LSKIFAHWDVFRRCNNVILTCTGCVKKNLTAFIAIYLICRNDNKESVEELEERILKQAVQDSIQPKLISDDLKIFQQLFEDTFTGTDTDDREPCLIEVYFLFFFCFCLFLRSYENFLLVAKIQNVFLSNGSNC